MRRSHVYIVGAGFSMHAGLPLQAGFTEELLTPRADVSHPMHTLVDHLGTFIHDAFDHNVSAKARFWPNLEDVFTNIDLAANTGHHLGQKHTPSSLRTTRRALLARMMYMLNEKYILAEKEQSEDWKKLEYFFKEVDTERSAFISINWDTVIERGLAKRHNVKSFEYRCGAKPATFSKTGNVISERASLKKAKSVPVVKIHGSVNWLYCDNCRELYWFAPSEAIQVAMQLVTHGEGKKFGFPAASGCGKWRCVNCTAVPLTTRIATFSFLKALDFPMFERSWLAAERLLRDADKWVFIGYSLPAADFEFKHLLKRVQLSREEPPEFVVITGGSTTDCDNTYKNYQRFFGRGIKRSDNNGDTFFADGLSKRAIKAAHE